MTTRKSGLAKTKNLTGEDIKNIIQNVCWSTDYIDQNMNPANIADVIGNVGEAITKVADAIDRLAVAVEVIAKKEEW